MTKKKNSNNNVVVAQPYTIGIHYYCFSSKL